MPRKTISNNKTDKRLAELEEKIRILELRNARFKVGEEVWVRVFIHSKGDKEDSYNVRVLKSDGTGIGSFFMVTEDCLTENIIDY